MVIAVSLLKAVPDQEKALYRAINGLEGITNLYHIFGDHDFFLILEAGSMNSLIGILDRIKGVGSVSEVKTMLVDSAGWAGMNACEMQNKAFPAA
jgi:hypothetical protein